MNPLVLKEKVLTYQQVYTPNIVRSFLLRSLSNNSCVGFERGAKPFLHLESPGTPLRKTNGVSTCLSRSLTSTGIMCRARSGTLEIPQNLLTVLFVGGNESDARAIIIHATGWSLIHMLSGLKSVLCIYILKSSAKHMIRAEDKLCWI